MDDAARLIDIYTFAQAHELSTMHVVALQSWLRTKRMFVQHATDTQWREWLQTVLQTEVTD